MSEPRVLFAEDEIRRRITDLAHAIARLPQPPEIMVPVLTGAFVFAADLARALAGEGLDVAVEFVRLASYGDGRSGGAVAVRAAPDDAVAVRRVLLVDGVLDRGHTLVAARQLLIAAGAASVTTAVVIDKRQAGAPLTADFACFTDVNAFVVGYGMDEAGLGRGLPYIATAE